MATKRISIDAEAYRRLAASRRDGESFSGTIKRLIPEPFDMNRWLARARRDGISDMTAQAAERHASSRRQRSRQRR
jgi:predicted CopG family antitoxin